MTGRYMSALVGTFLILLAVALLFLGSPVKWLHTDTRVTFTGPRAESTVSLPVTLTWNAHGLPAGQRFAVFIDRPPVPVGRSVTSLVANQQGVYVTSGDSLTLADLPYTVSQGSHIREVQSIQLVYVDFAGRRVSQSSFSLEFFLHRTVSL